jgi:hypothetical protein
VEDLQAFFQVGYRIAQTDRWPEWKPGTELTRRDSMLKEINLSIGPTPHRLSALALSLLRSDATERTTDSGSYRSGQVAGGSREGTVTRCAVISSARARLSLVRHQRPSHPRRPPSGWRSQFPAGDRRWIWLSFFEGSRQPTARVHASRARSDFSALMWDDVGVPAQRGSVTFQYCSLKGSRQTTSVDRTRHRARTARMDRPCGQP